MLKGMNNYLENAQSADKDDEFFIRHDRYLLEAELRWLEEVKERYST